MFTETESQFLREEPYFGLGKFETFKKLIYGDVNFLKSQYAPLSSWASVNIDNFNTNTIKKYFEILNFSL